MNRNHWTQQSMDQRARLIAQMPMARDDDDVSGADGWIVGAVVLSIMGAFWLIAGAVS